MRHLLGIGLMLVVETVAYSGNGAVAIPRPSAPPREAHDLSAAPPSLRASYWRDQAFLLAGKPLPEGSPFYGVSRTPAFQKHAARMRSYWWPVFHESLDQIGKWREKNIPKDLETRSVFYPLSGADYLNAYAFFPHARNYLFIALETPGSMPDVTKMDEREREEGLIAIRRAVESLASANYMQSKVLRREMSNPVLPGTLPVFLMLAGAMGQTVLEAHAVTLDDAGDIKDCDFEPYPQKPRRDSTIRPSGLVRGFRIVVRDPSEAESKTILYLQIHLREDAVTSRTPEGRFLLRLQNFNTILKSAIYLLHNDSYEGVRKYILQRSSLVLQDDSGLPYASFNKEVWDEHLFGTYTKIPPLGGVPHPPQQPQLARRYRERSEPLDFPYGYGVLQGKDHSNLMLFIRKTSGAAIR